MMERGRGTWSIKAPLSAPRSHPAVSVYGGRIYSFGGGGPAFKSLNLSEVYDPSTDRWSSLRPMPTFRSGAAAVTIGNAIYIIGGGFKKPDGKFKFLTTVEVYYPEEDRWEAGPDLLQPHDYPAFTLLDGTIYLIGGHHPNATEGGPQTDPAFSFSERWSPGMKSWEEFPPMLTPRFAASGVAVGNALWVLGGVAFTPQGFNEYDRIEVYHPQLGAWAPSPLTLPWPSAGQGAAVLNGRLYLFGGFRGEAGIGSHGAVCDLAKKSWTELPPMPQPRAAMGVAAVGQTFYLIGGWAADRSVMESVAVYRED
ncbi:MAG TPA: kelch repeat-containing protein [Candidatus Manganitrophaceae bacterium]|nr:kelch repeat-containing protein [Candidatus Manganitrophaceae bacterium]